MTQKIIRTRRVQDIVNIWCVAARKLCLIVDSQVMNWSCTLSTAGRPTRILINTFMPSTLFWYHFDNIYEV